MITAYICPLCNTRVLKTYDVLGIKVDEIETILEKHMRDNHARRFNLWLKTNWAFLLLRKFLIF
jgi:hypothetical protein